MEVLLFIQHKNALYYRQPLYLYHCSSDVSESLAQCYDTYGDSYTTETSVDELKQLIDNMPSSNDSKNVKVVVNE